MPAFDGQDSRQSRGIKPVSCSPQSGLRAIATAPLGMLDASLAAPGSPRSFRFPPARLSKAPTVRKLFLRFGIPAPAASSAPGMKITKKGHRHGGALHLHRWTLGLAAEVLWRRKSCQRPRVWVAISAAQRARGGLELKPLEQGLVLHVVRPSVQGNREQLVGKSFDYVPVL